MAIAGTDPFPIIKAMGHADIKTTMIYVSLGKSHIRDQVEQSQLIGQNELGVDKECFRDTGSGKEREIGGWQGRR